MTRFARLGRSYLAATRRELIRDRDQVVQAAERAGRAAFTDGEERRFRELTDEIRGIDTTLTDLDAEPARVQVLSEPRTYQPDGPWSFFGDVAAAKVGQDPDAIGRLARHRREAEVELTRREAHARAHYDDGLEDATREVRALTADDGTSGADFAPPMWITEAYAERVRAGRSFSRQVNQRPLPIGTSTIKVPVVDDGFAAGGTGPDTPPANVDLEDRLLTIPVRQIAAQVDVAHKVLDLNLVDDRLIAEDLGSAYDNELGRQVLVGSGSGREVRGLLNVDGATDITFTDADPDFAALHAKIGEAATAVVTRRQQRPRALLLHGRRFYWATSQTDDDGRPLLPSADPDAMGDTDGGPVARWHRMPTWTDQHMPTGDGAADNQDVIALTRPGDHWLWESPWRLEVDVVTRGRALEVVFTLHAYLAFTAERYPSATALIRGTGLIPTLWTPEV
ncbi:MAG: phage major capsid protein [Nitriliruptoraceae bacterium]|nr:phage major capsid protein [Nitriliruptoraceae bacterium]